VETGFSKPSREQRFARARQPFLKQKRRPELDGVSFQKRRGRVALF
jgi:hypothetical protein